MFSWSMMSHLQTLVALTAVYFMTKCKKNKNLNQCFGYIGRKRVEKSMFSKDLKRICQKKSDIF
jgi:hypothetical protein